MIKEKNYAADLDHYTPLSHTNNKCMFLAQAGHDVININRE